MGNRYGRNQKRRARERILLLEHKNEQLQRGMENALKQAAVAEENLNKVINRLEAISKYSVALPVKESKGIAERDSYELGILGEISFDPWEKLTPERGLCRVVNLYKLDIFLAKNRENLQTAVHLKYTNKKHSVYMLSDMAMYTMSREELIYRVTEALVEHFKNEEK